MKKDINYKFNVSVSREGYPDKETAKMCLSSHTSKELGMVKMAFKQQEISVDEFLDYAINGYSFCNLFKFDENKKYWLKSGKHYTKTYPVYKVGKNKGYFKLNFKSDEYFYGSQTIFVDIDFTHYTKITDYLNSLTYLPTCVYMSFSDKANKKGIVSRRFRLVYVFDSILNADEFRDVTFTLYDSIVRDTNEPMYDSCGCSYSQYMNGGNSNETYTTNIIYSLSDFTTADFSPEVIENTTTEEKPVKSNTITFSEELIADMENSPYKYVVEKWWNKGLRYFSKTELDFNDNYYVTTTDDYCSLFYHYEKVCDGNQRRKKLYLRAALRRLMKDTTPDELLYNLYIDRERFFDNSDDVITIDVLIAKVKGALLTDINTIKTFLDEYDKPAFVINPIVNNKHKAVAMARKDITDNKIGELYDTSLTVQENLQILNDNNVSISQTRLYQWVKDYSINLKKEIIYNPNVSIRQNMKLNDCTKYQIEKAKKEYEMKNIKKSA